MYEKNGEKYFIVDSHMHYWNAAPDNWVPGAEQYAKGWIECFHAYQSLGPKETHWPIDHFQKYSEDDLMKDVFEDGHVDVAIFQPTYLKEWYKEGFNTTERNAALGEKHPGMFIANTRFDPRDGDDGPRGAAAQRRALRLQGREALHRGVEQRLPRLQAQRPGAPTGSWRRRRSSASRTSTCTRARRSGRWTRTRSTSSDVDHAATDFPELNFIIEHVGLPRIDDFCYMATQEPNVYAGLSVVIGALMHARPKFFARVMGELLFWVGEDKMTFGSDYGIWEPKWQVEGFVDWQMPDDEQFADYQKLTTATKKKILGLNAAKLYDIKVPDECQLPAEAASSAAKDDAQLVTGQ